MRHEGKCKQLEAEVDAETGVFVIENRANKVAKIRGKALSVWKLWKGASTDMK